ncbi:MAG: hypothetical protein Q8N47_17095 [Bryobacterales bacterium]|nr:hypothetical protein [Bryobacterales bacterium]
MAGVLAAERPEESWTNLNVLRAQQKIRVVRTNLKSIEGAFSACSDEAISLRVKGDLVSVPRAEVFRVTLQERSKRLRNTLIGMAIGGGAALAIGAAVDKSFSEDNEHIAKTIFTPIGLGAGAGIGAAITGFPTVYRGKLPARASAVQANR